ncbi:MAG: LuxR family transcriptional regulator [Bacteroidota bacterium]|nr:LuxR family transcriptional regulator [Bacteroidota bacterium]
MNSSPQPEFENERTGPTDIRTEIDKYIAGFDKARENKGMLTLKPANQWMAEASINPIPKMLFSEFWFEGEICILFADTNVGKSILAVQIGNSISKGEAIRGFKLEAEKQPVLYFDFELTAKQLENRYSKDFSDHYNFDEDFSRVEINSCADIPEHLTFEQYLAESIEQSIIETGAQVLIIDNLTYLRNETEKARDALPLMKELKALKNRYRLSLLALAHTPKRDPGKPITRNDLQGSKMLMNFCDSSFSIGESYSDKSLRYIKQIKARNTEIIYDGENVCLCHIDKPHNFLQFGFLNFGKEYQHLKQCTDEDRSTLAEGVIELKRTGLSLRDIAVELGVSHMKVKRILNEKPDDEKL